MSGLNVQRIVAGIDAYINEHWLDVESTDTKSDIGGFVIRQRPRAIVRKMCSLEANEAQAYEGPFDHRIYSVLPHAPHVTELQSEQKDARTTETSRTRTPQP